jgi:hypothetical protein
MSLSWSKYSPQIRHEGYVGFRKSSVILHSGISVPKTLVASNKARRVQQKFRAMGMAMALPKRLFLTPSEITFPSAWVYRMG